MTEAVVLRDLNKSFRIYEGGIQKLRGLFRFGMEIGGREIRILKDINLSIEKGKTLGIIGLNGAGKTTLLQIIAGIIYPTSGDILTNGRVAAIMDLGLGFHPDFTGRENALMKGIIMGFTKKEISSRLDEIIAFSEIGEYIAQPLRIYSSGMLLRLAFATAIHTDPDILLIDEALAVGDERFQRKCFRKMNELKEAHKTIIFVSHDLQIVNAICDEAVLLDNGRIVARGCPRDVTNVYHMRINEEAFDGKVAFPIESGSMGLEYGTGDAKIERVFIQLDEREVSSELISGKKYRFCMTVRFFKNITHPVFGVNIKTVFGLDVFGSNTFYLKKNVGQIPEGAVVKVNFDILVSLTQAKYFVTFGVGELIKGQVTFLDRKVDSLMLKVSSLEKCSGLVNLTHDITWEHIEDTRSA